MPVEGGIGLGLVGSVVLLAEHEIGEGARYPDEGAIVGRSRFEQAYLVGQVGRQAVGEHAAGRAGAYDDVIEVVECCHVEEVLPSLKDIAEGDPAGDRPKS